MKRGLYSTHAVVLSSFDYGDSDRILGFYTEDYGKIKGIAKGARRSRKRFVGNLEPMSRIKLIFFHNEGSDLCRVEDSTLADGFPGLKSGIERLSNGYYLLELVSEMTREGQPLQQVYGLLCEFLKMLDDGADAQALLRYFEIKLLAILGYLPHLGGCVACRSAIEGENGERVYFSSERGGIVCARCAPGMTGLVPVSPGTARLLDTAARFDNAKLARLKPARTFLDEGEAILEDFIRHQLGKELKTRKFLGKLKGAAL